MKPAPFVRHVPKTLDEALKILAEVAPKDGRVLAGGQSLVPIMAFRLAKPAHLVDINEVAGLDRIASDGKTLSIGARVRHAAFHDEMVDCAAHERGREVARAPALLRVDRPDRDPRPGYAVRVGVETTPVTLAHDAIQAPGGTRCRRSTSKGCRQSTTKA